MLTQSSLAGTRPELGNNSGPYKHILDCCLADNGTLANRRRARVDFKDIKAQLLSAVLPINIQTLPPMLCHKCTGKKHPVYY